MRYKLHLNKMIQRSGRKRIWISDQLDMDRTTFWRKANNDTFTEQEKVNIDKLLT